MTDALTLFRQGKDTAEIAAIMKTTEADAYNELAREREAARKARYKAFTFCTKEESRGKIPYAGREY